VGHLAIAIEDRALLEQQTRGLDIALEPPPGGDDDPFGSFDRTLESARDEESRHFNHRFDEASLADMKLSFRQDPPRDLALDSKGVAEPKISVELAPGIEKAVELASTPTHSESLAIRSS
jgi:hypothetical protein